MASLGLVKEYMDKIPELLSQPRISFLFGAGCSVCAGLPFMGKLTDQICQSLDPQNVTDADEKLAYRLLHEVRSGFDGLINVSIEDYLSEIQDIDAILCRQCRKGKADPCYLSANGQYMYKHTQILLKKIKEKIREILGKDITTIKYHRNFCKAIHGDLVMGRTRAKHTVNYFILNYDTLFEDALALEGVVFTDGFVGGATAWWSKMDINHECNSTIKDYSLEARVYKLHGSIDWIRPEYSEFPMRLRHSLPQDEIIGLGEPVVIYPSSSKYKETQHDPYAQMLLRFRNHLTTTENHVLAIIGYGFNDEHINMEVYESIRNSSGALSVVIFSGNETLPKPIDQWVRQKEIASQILFLGKREIWKDGKIVYKSSDDIDWYKFETISDMLSGVR